MNYSVFDIEANGLLDTVTKIHCLSVKRYHNGECSRFSTTDYGEMRKFFATEECIVGHKIKTYDVPAVEQILQIKISSRLIDSLFLSWYLYPFRKKHGLEEWGEELGVSKPKILNWDNLPVEEYMFRCQEDVTINDKLFSMFLGKLSKIYNGNGEDIKRLINYLMFKADCALEQENVKWKCDRPKTEENLEFFYKKKEEKLDLLAKVMPPKVHYKIKEMPKKPYKKDGTPSSTGEQWFSLLKEQDLPEHYNGAVRVLDKVVQGNPASPEQVKDWLNSLGWQPDEFRYEKDKETGKVRAIPQVGSQEKSGELSQSVKNLIKDNPSLKHLGELGVINHRIGLLKGFLKNMDENDFLQAQVQGLTNTLRFQHTTIVNLPTIPKPYWQKVRECLIAPDENHVLCGADMSSLEDNTKQHYMYFYDPDYVNEMRVPGFDPHLDIAVLAGMLTKEQAEEHKLYEKTEGKEGKSYKPIRLKAKKVNFAGVYGAGPPKIALTANIPLEEAQTLHKTYWIRNKAVKQIALDAHVQVHFKSGKVVHYKGRQLITMNREQMTLFMAKVESMWLFNPVSKFWYSLRYVKDIFSTLNQGTGVYCFDSWVRKVRAKGIKICGQFHDEKISATKKGHEEKHKSFLFEAIEETNEEIKLNVKLGISVAFGHSYADIH